MIIINYLKIQTDQNFFSKNSPKYIKFELPKKIISSNFSGKHISDRELQWKQQFIFPQEISNSFISYEIYSKHLFGYHENELKMVLFGKIKIENKSSKAVFPVNTYINNKPVGYLSFTTTQSNSNAIKQINSKNDRILIIKSFIAHIPSLRHGSVFFRLETAAGSIETYSSRTVTGDLVFVETLKLQISSEINEGVLELRYQNQNNSQESEIYCQGKIILAGKPIRKIFLTNEKYQQMGDVIVDYQIVPKNWKDRFTEPKKMNKEANKLSVVNSNVSVTLNGQQRFKNVFYEEGKFITKCDDQKTKKKRIKTVKKQYQYKIGTIRSEKTYKNIQSHEDVSKQSETIFLLQHGLTRK